MSALEFVTLEVDDPAVAEAFYDRAFGLGDRVRVRASDAPTSGFRGFTMSLVVAQPADVDALAASALEAGATVIKQPAKSLWGYGGSVQAPDGTIWTLASSSKKNRGPATGEVEDVVLLLGVADVKASKRFYVDHGLTVGRSFGGKYAELDAPGSRIKLALNPRKLAAGNAGVPEEGSGSHRLVVAGDAGFTDPDGFVWESPA